MKIYPRPFIFSEWVVHSLSGRMVCPRSLVIKRADVNSLLSLVSQADSIAFVDDSAVAA